jgi:hypothetical protein
MKCKVCNAEFIQKRGLRNFCSTKCRSSRHWTDLDKLKKSESAKKSIRVLQANRSRPKFSIEKTCIVCKNTFIVTQRKQQNQKTCSIECKHTGYKTGVYVNSYKDTGGYRRGSGRGKSGWYQGIWCDSSYELAWVIYNLDHGIEFERNSKYFIYEYNGKSHKYYPDFRLIKTGELVEIKGIMNDLVSIKLRAVDQKIILIDKTDIIPYITYVKIKYGSNFIKLYSL